MRGFCPAVPKDHPSRLEKLLNILDMNSAIKLLIILPKGSLTSEDLSSHSKLKPFILDFIDDARELLDMSSSEILDILLDLIN